MTQTMIDPTPVNLHDGERVRISWNGCPVHLHHTIGWYGRVEHCAISSEASPTKVIVVKFERGGEFSYPRQCIEKAPQRP